MFDVYGKPDRVIRRFKISAICTLLLGAVDNAASNEFQIMSFRERKTSVCSRIVFQMSYTMRTYREFVNCSFKIR